MLTLSDLFRTFSRHRTRPSIDWTQFMNEEDELLVPDDKNLEQELYVFVVLQASC